jgi:two-component system NarL family sensor kinase
MEGDCYCLDTFRAGDLEGAANVNIITCTRLQGLVDGTAGLRAHASVPLYAHGKRLGVLNVVSGDWRELSAEELRLLYTVGDLVGIAIERARLFAASTQIGALEERNRLAREIHDTLVQGLTGIIMQLETADALLERTTDRGREALRQALALTRSNLDEARRSVLDLRAAPLEGRSLDTALAALAHDWTVKTRLKIDFETFGIRHLRRVWKPAVSHRAGSVDQCRAPRAGAARDRSHTSAVQLAIEDDGVGFDPARAPSGRHGLIGMQERSRLLGGKLELCSDPDGGTRVLVNVPL